tara:strand:+ start:1171 stop:2550 length:1380 start_codon:yes stop_codon:yes gene_type:complete
MASTYLSQTISSSTGKKFTLSMWVKRANVGSSHMLFHLSSDSGSTNYLDFAIKNNDKLDVQLRNGSSTTYYRKRTNRLLRDVNAWYHLVWRFDSTNSTADDRWIMYINGERVTDIDLDSTPSQVSSDYVTPLNRDGATLQIGNVIGGSMHLDGSLAHVHLCDGYSYAPTEFGETDATTGIWKPKTAPSVTYGTNGFFLKFENSAAMGTDSSGQGNNLTVSGNCTQTIDTPSNVYCTMNPLDNQIASSTFSNGNNTIVTNSSNYTWNTGTLGVSSGKYYWEVKYGANSNSNIYNLIGIADRPTTSSTAYLGSVTSTSNYAYYSDNGNVYAKSGSSTSFGNSYGVGDIIGVAVDLDNNKLYFAKNGTWQNSGDPTSGSTGTGAISIDAISSTTTGFYFPASGDYGSSQYVTNHHNFGNGYFGTTAVASAENPDDGNGIFEYDVPAGYRALCTKSINAEEYS